MAIYSNLSKLGRVKLPSGSEYALIDVDGRAMLAPNFSAEASYSEGDHVIYGDNLYRFKVDHSAGEWNAAHADQITIDTEIKRLEGIMSGGIHYRGKTVTPLYEGATTNPISIGGVSYTADSGDLVIFDLGLANAAAYATNTAYNVGTYVIHESITYLVTDAISAIENTSWSEISSKVTSVGVNPIRTYAVATAYSANTYIKNAGIVYISNDAISAADNENFAAIEEKLGVVKSDPEFLFDGSKWNILGSISDGLGDLAFKDSASGTYRRPTGSGTVTIPTVSSGSEKLVTTSITPTNGTVNATYVTGGTEKDIAKVGTAVRYGTANVGESVVYGTANRASSATVYGTADVGTEVEVGTSLTGTTTFNTDAIKSASLTGTKTFNTDAIKSATATGTDGTTAAKEGILTSVSGDCLNFSTAGTTTISVSTTAASTGTVGISTTAASTATVGLGKTGITPAVAAPSTQTIYGAVSAPNSQTLTPAVAAPNDQTLTPAASNGKLTGSYTLSQQTPAAVGSAVTVATGSTSGSGTGSTVVTSVSVGTTTGNVDVGYENSTVTVR